MEITITDIPEWMRITVTTLAGLMIGSFLNVVIYRVPRNQSVVTPRSRCPECSRAISAIENIPILSWVFMKGRCHGCGAGISWRYPVVELLTSILFAVAAFVFPETFRLIPALVMISCSVALAFIDAKHFLLPNRITYPAFIFFLAWSLGGAISSGDSELLVKGLMGSLVGGGSLLVIGLGWKALRGVEAMGLGDVKMMAAFGMWLGWELALLSIFIGAFAGSLAGLLIMHRDSESGMQTRIPFGIFLAVGSVTSLFWGEDIVNLYLRLSGLSS